jgi:hypothetical protein
VNLAKKQALVSRSAPSHPCGGGGGQGYNLEMAAPRVQAVPPKPLPSEARLIKKERFLTCLNKMNDRDTQKRAAEELMELISVGKRPVLALQNPPAAPWRQGSKVLCCGVDQAC